MDDFSFFDCSSPFCFLLINFHYVGIQFVVPFNTLLVPKFFKFCLQGVFGGSGNKTTDMINGTRHNGWYLAHLHLLVVVLVIYRSELLSIPY